MIDSHPHLSPSRKRGNAFSLACASGSIFVFLALHGPLHARTITITAEDCDQMACISANLPRLSWAMIQSAPGVINSQPQLHFGSKQGLLMRFPINDIVPKGQRITKAEFTIAPSYMLGTGASVHVRRVLAEWGTGVCHQYRMTHPQKLEWAQPGGRGAATDRVNKDSAIFKITKAGEYTVDVTEDIELWYTGGAVNRGWILTLERDGEVIYLPSPYTVGYLGGGKSWKMLITFEPQ